MHTEAPISITASTADKRVMATVRASNGAELDQLLVEAISSITAAVAELQAVTGQVVHNTAVPPQPQVASIAAQFGATVIETGNTIPAQEYAAPGVGARQCPHGTMTRIHGMTGKFGPYKGHFCPAKQGDPSKCTTIYVKAGSPEFATFTADQTKA